jgi:hypothetical protein
MAGTEGGKRSEGGSPEQFRRPSYVDARRYPSDEEAARAYHESQEARVCHSAKWSRREVMVTAYELP